MKIKRAQLINIIQGKLDQLDTDRVRRYEQALKDYQAAENKYFQDTRTNWAQFAETIETALSRGRILRQDNVPEGLKSRSWGAVRFFDGKPPVPPQPHEQEEHLRTLIKVLEQTSDEEISTYSLEKMGFSLGRILK